jgi:hypothetical protein
VPLNSDVVKRNTLLQLRVAQWHTRSESQLLSLPHWSDTRREINSVQRMWHSIQFPAFLLLLLPLCICPTHVSAVPFSAVSSLVTFRYDFDHCTLVAAGLNISEITAQDLAPFHSALMTNPCGNNTNGELGPVSGMDFSNNTLRALPSDLFTLLAMGQWNVVDLSKNGMTEVSLSNMFSSTQWSVSGACVFCGPSVASKFSQLELSFNMFGPSIPSAFSQLWMPSFGSRLLLRSNLITDVPSHAFAGARFDTLYLSLNDLSSGLRAYSFSGITSSSFSLFLHNCKLRSSSLVPGWLESNTTRSSVFWRSVQSANTWTKSSLL